MSEQSTAETAINVPPLAEPRELTGFRKSLVGAAFLVTMGAAAYGARRCFLEESAATQVIAGLFADSSTQLREMTNEMAAKLDSVLDDARLDIIEDGMSNAINTRLADLVAQDFKTVIPALVSVIESGRTAPIVAAEILKELGRVQSAASHASRLWTLERGLSLSSPFIRDGAGLGLARLSDPDALPYLCRALESETNAQTRADLQLVIDELSETITDGPPVAGCD